MKKTTKILLASGFALLLSAGAVINFLQPADRSAQNVSNLTLANIEALAIPEGPDLDGGLEDDSYVICYYESRVKKGYTYYDCANCSKKVYDEQGKGQYSKCFLN